MDVRQHRQRCLLLAHPRCSALLCHGQVALLQHLFTRVLPVPDCSSPQQCFWHAPMRYALQVKKTMNVIEGSVGLP